MNNEIVELLGKLVKINSVFPGESGIVNFVFEFLKAKGYKPKKVKVEKNRYNITVEKGIGEKSILLYSHLDTVGVTEGWKTDPFKLTIKGNRAFGLGAWDMKAGMATNMQAFFDYSPQSYKLKMVFCIDEENISKGGHLLAKSEFMRDVACIISCEPSFYHGNNGIVTGRPGRAVFTLNISAVPRHYALYEKKYDMNFFISDFIAELGNLYLKRADRKQFVFARTIQSKSLGISTPMTTQIELDSSVIPPNSNETILNKIIMSARKINSKYDNYFSVDIRFKERETPFLESYEIDKNNPYLKVLSEAVRNVTDNPSIPYFRTSVADENIFGSMGKSVFSIGPTGGNAHSPNEWVSLHSVGILYKIIKDFLLRSETYKEKSTK
jgi:acetylornithine deacetylase/succinyl-diaminopimelate desuccinylase-like protein